MKLRLFLTLLAPLFFAQISSAQSTPTSFAYILQADSFAKTKSAAAEKLTACDRDWIVLDAVFSSDSPWERADLDAIRKNHPARKIIAYLSIGEAEDYRPYWRKEWGTGKKLTSAAPKWLGQENPDWKGNYRVHYWHPEWQQLMLTAIDDVIARGFDGIYLDIVDGFENFERDGKKFIDDRLNPETKQSYRRDMVDWVKAIAARARVKNPQALVIPQNGSQLLAHADFLDTISAIGIEDLFTNGDKLQPKDSSAYILGYLQKMTAKQKPVLLIEYSKSPERQALSKKLTQEHHLTLLITDRELKTLGISGK
ncbi:MAG TPA: MJ1477/TM1410 family putative glycoside hydrolase [Verrucomicrobiae bacterium]